MRAQCTFDTSSVTRYQEYLPPPDLAAHVACTCANMSQALPLAPEQPIVPDGCADIIMFGDESPHVAGPATSTQWVRMPTAGTLIAAIRFKPGALRSIPRCDADELGPWGVELTAVCRRQAYPLIAELATTDVPSAHRAALEAWTRQRR